MMYQELLEMVVKINKLATILFKVDINYYLIIILVFHCEMLINALEENIEKRKLLGTLSIEF